MLLQYARFFWAITHNNEPQSTYSRLTCLVKAGCALKKYLLNLASHQSNNPEKNPFNTRQARGKKC